MKKIAKFRKSLFKTILVASTLFGASCMNDQKPEATQYVADENAEAKPGNTPTTKDPQFLADAAEINLTEIQLGQLAQQKGTMQEVKELGKMMEEDHRKSLNDLIELARKKSVVIPTSPTDNTWNTCKKINDKSGTSFDVAYCDMMVNGHMDAIAIFDKAYRESTDNDVKEWIAATLPRLKAHLDHAINCQKTVQNKTITNSN